MNAIYIGEGIRMVQRKHNQLKGSLEIGEEGKNSIIKMSLKAKHMKSIMMTSIKYISNHNKCARIKFSNQKRSISKLDKNIVYTSMLFTKDMHKA